MSDLCKQNTKQMSRLGDVYLTYNLQTDSEKAIVPVTQKLSDLKVDLASWELVNCKNTHEPQCQQIQFCDKKVKINFDFGDITLPNEKEPFQMRGQIPMLISLGCTPPQDLDLKHLTESQKISNEINEKLGIFDKDSKYFNKFQDSGIPQFCVVTAPGLKLEDMQAYLILVLAFFIIDDNFDNTCDFQGEDLSVYETTQAVTTFCSILCGKMSPSDLDKTKGSSRFPKFYSICKLMELLRAEVLKLEKNVEETENFFTSFATYLEATAWESLGWSDPTRTDSEALKRLYFIQRDLTIGARPCINLVCLLKGVVLDPEIRKDPLFISLQYIFARLAILHNDIFSFQKEIKNGENSNIILLRNLKKPAQHCITKTLEELEHFIQDVFGIQRQLEQKFPNAKDLSMFFEIGNLWSDGHLRWMLLCSRYSSSICSVNFSDN